MPELTSPPDYVNLVHAAPGMTAYERRKWCVRRYAFAVPTEAALARLARHAPIVELGAGNGYWTHLLLQREVDCIAYDLAPPDRAANAHAFLPSLWTQVRHGGIEVLAQHAARALLLCWPPHRDPFAAQALSAYAGRTLLYIGEPAGGHTADDAFFMCLARDWDRVDEVALPNWPGTRDSLSVYRRRA